MEVAYWGLTLFVVRITNIAFKWIELKTPVIECVAFTIRVHCKLSLLHSRMRCNSMIDCVVCFWAYRTRCTRMRCNINGILRKLPACKYRIALRVIGTVEEYAYTDSSVSKSSSFSPAIPPKKTLRCFSCPLYLLGLSYFLSQIIQYPMNIWNTN